MSSPDALRIHTNRRQDFDSYFPLEAYEEDAQVYRSDLASLPFPAPLSSLRADFRGESFDCDDFLVRHQKHGQLDDLLLELRGLSSQLEGELVRGVEDDYEAFIGLGKMDSRKVDELRRGVSAIKEQLEKMEADIEGNLAEIDETLAAQRNLRTKQQMARAQLAISRSVDELAYLLQGQVVLGDAVEAYVQLQTLLTHGKLSEHEQVRHQELEESLRTKLQTAIRNSSHDEKFHLATLLRDFYHGRAMTAKQNILDS